jgi:hypothetical protein
MFIYKDKSVVIYTNYFLAGRTFGVGGGFD